ncbi:MAG TPA: tetratricopeptide repeat protein [Tepidisphaeraceae bacterium]|jgi:tetratricopeptide (TPR) repeat protein
MRKLHLAAVVVTALLAGGCANKNKQKQSGAGFFRPSKDQADELNSEHSKFEKSEDPPIAAHTYFAAGQLSEAQDEPTKAIQQYKLALKQDPNHLQSMYQLGTLYTQLRMYGEAIATWQQYVKATNGSAVAYGNLGFALELARKPREAEEAFKKGIARDGSEQLCRVNYGLMLTRQDRVDEAIQQLGAVLKPAEVHYNLGSVYEQQGKKELAKSEYEKALLMDVNLHDASKRLKGLK